MFCPCRCKGCGKGTGNYSSVTEQTHQFERSGSSTRRVNIEGLVKDDNRAGQMQRVLLAYVKLKKVLTGSSPKAKTQTFDSTGIESDDKDICKKE